MTKTFIAFNTVTGSALTNAASAESARVDAVRKHQLDNDDFIEVIDASKSDIPLSVLMGRFLYQCRHLPSVWRGAGYIRGDK